MHNGDLLLDLQSDGRLVDDQVKSNAWENRLNGGLYDSELSALYSADPTAPRARYAALLAAFSERFGGDADVSLISAPGRTELAGNHTDHQNGVVLCAAVTMDTLAAAAPRCDDTVRIVSQGFGEICLRLNELSPRPEETGTSESIVRGVAAGFRSSGYSVGGLDAILTSDVPAGGGLSSSAAFEVLIGTLFSHFYNDDRADALTLAILGQGAERDYFGKPSGLMDQTASACGGITRIDFADPAHPLVERLRFDFRQSGYVLCAVDTRTSHADLTEDYASIPAEMKSVASFFGKRVLREVDPGSFQDPKNRAALARQVSPRAILRAEHFFEENERAGLMADVLARGEMKRYIELMNASGASSRYKLQNVIPSRHPDQASMAEALDRAGALLEGRGAWRIHGGGFAGCIQCLVPEEDYPSFRAAMDGYYGSGACREMRVRPCGPYILGSDILAKG